MEDLCEDQASCSGQLKICEWLTPFNQRRGGEGGVAPAIMYVVA